MRLLPTASKVALWFTCAYGFRDDVPVDPDRPNAYRNFGLANHDALEILHDGHFDPDLAAIADKRELTPVQRLAFPKTIRALAEINAPKLAHSEVAFALDLDTGEARELGRRIGREYEKHGARPGIDVCGTPDLAWMCPEESLRGYVRIVDLKSGFEGRVIDHIEQLMTCAALVCRAWNARGAMLTIFHVIDGEVREDNVIVEDYELDAHVARLDARRRETPDAQPNPGPHCRSEYCTAIDSCPEGQRTVAMLVPADRLTAPVKLRGKIESEHEARVRVALLPLAKENLKRYIEECEEYALEHGGVRTPDGKWWGQTSYPERAIKAREAAAVLIDELGEDGAARVASVEITQAAIKRELEAQGVSPVASALERIMKKLAAAGAVDEHEKKTFSFRNKPPFLPAKKGAA